MNIKTKVAVYLATIILFWDFGILNAQINAGNDTAICNHQPIELNATLIGLAGTTHYTFKETAFNPEPYDGAIALVDLNDDTVTTAIPIGFNFCFLGKSYSQFYIGANGWLGFMPNQQTTNFQSAPIPNRNAGTPKNCIMAAWQDWGTKPPSVGGQVFYKTVGSKLIVTWLKMPLFSCSSELGTFQIVLNETSNIIEIYIEKKPPCSWKGGNCTQGLHDSSGTVAFTVDGRNSTVWTANKEGWQFIPTGISWYEKDSLIGIGSSVIVTPTITTTYKAKITACGGSKDSDYVTVNMGIIPHADFDFKPTVVTLEDSLVKFTDLSSSAVPIIKWEWDFGDGTNLFATNPKHYYRQDGTYLVRLLISNFDGCSDSTTKYVIVKDDYTLYLPNAFSPGNNDINDGFGAKASGIDESSFEMSIYNRWGQELFHTKDIYEYWKGTLNNTGTNYVPTGTYVYHINFKDKNTGNSHSKIGHFLLIK